MNPADRQPPTLRDEDLVARALDALPEVERTRVDTQLAGDAAARARFETIAAHLLVYDQLEPAPPPPSFARIEAALEADDGAPDLAVLRLQDARPAPRRRFVGAGLAAAAVLLAVLGWNLLAGKLPGASSDRAVPLIAGAGLERIAADGVAQPAPALAQVDAAVGDVLTCRAPAEAHLGDRIRLVLDAEARLRLEGSEAVTLLSGRAWFEVRPGAFEVRTPHGPVRVLGTAFEVDLRGDALAVSVAHGRVAAGGHEIGASDALTDGRVAAATYPAGAWFRQPTLHVVGPRRVEGGRPLRLTLTLANPGRVAIPLRGPSDVRHALWLHLESDDGRPVRELPILPAHVLGDAGFLKPTADAMLLPGRPLRIEIEIPAPFTSPGTYLCRALFRPEGLPGVLSDARRLEVR